MEGDFFIAVKNVYGNNKQVYLSSIKFTAMAEIKINNKKDKHPLKKAAKRSLRVDLTPMVDLGFLLITFFVFTTTMAKATAMEIKSPYGDEPGKFTL